MLQCCFHPAGSAIEGGVTALASLVAVGVAGRMRILKDVCFRSGATAAVAGLASAAHDKAVSTRNMTARITSSQIQTRKQMF